MCNRKKEEDEEESYKMFHKPLLSGLYYVPFITIYNMYNHKSGPLSESDRL